MGELSGDLKNMGYELTEKDSPFHDDGRLWTNGVELVCDETGIVIDGTYNGGGGERNERGPFHYPNSGRVKMIGGYFSAYNWGSDEDGFHYE